MGDDISSDAIIYAAPVAAGPTHERDPAPAREEESGGAESAVASFVVADPFAGNRSVAGLLLESCEAPVDSFGSATVGWPFGICQSFFQTGRCPPGRERLLAGDGARNFRRTVKFVTLPA